MDIKDFPSQLLELANELQETAPKGQANPKPWMRQAGHFADACMVNGRLSQQLLTAIPLSKQGDFIDHVKSIKTASGIYNIGLRPNIDSALAFIIKVLNREVQAEPKYRFSVGSIPELANKLTVVQKRVFDDVWNHFIASGKPFPIRSLPRIIGKQSIEEAFKGLDGSLIYETTEEGDRGIKLTAYGVFLTGHGIVLAVLLVRLLDLVKELYEGDSFIKEIDNNQIKDRLNISDAEIQLLFKLLNIGGLPPGMPIRLGGWTRDESSWRVSITDEVIDLFRSDNTIAYLNDCLSAGYRSDEPYSHDARLMRHLQSAALLNPLPGTFPAMANHLREQSVSPYVNLLRLKELKKIQNTRFDCTRLICMCEELNKCASHGHAHAVIMLTRAILDHVPPAFGFKSFAEVASSYIGGGTSFKKSIERLENHSRKVADRLLHMPIRDKEVAPTMQEVSFAAELETMLAEFCRLLK